MRLFSTIAALALVSGTLCAHAGYLTGTYSVTASEGSTGSAFDTANGNPFSCSGYNTACASFTYTGALNFVDNSGQNNPGSGDLNSNFFTTGVISNYGATDTTPHTVRTTTEVARLSPTIPA